MIPISNATTLVEQYLEAEEREDLALLLGLLDENVIICNAASPVDDQPGAAERFARAFWDRTEVRSFSLGNVAVSDDIVFAFVDATMRFRKGAAFGPVTAAEAFTINLPVVIRFDLNADHKVTKLGIFHETTTAARLAVGAAA